MGLVLAIFSMKKRVVGGLRLLKYTKIKELIFTGFAYDEKLACGYDKSMAKQL